MSFILPVELLPVDEQEAVGWAIAGARAAGTPMISFFSPEETVALARDCGLEQARCVSTDELAERYFTGRSDGLRPSHGEQLLIATV